MEVNMRTPTEINAEYGQVCMALGDASSKIEFLYKEQQRLGQRAAELIAEMGTIKPEVKDENTDVK